MPTPRPETLPTPEAVENPPENEVDRFGIGQRLGLGSAEKPFSTAAIPEDRGIHSPAVVLDLNDDVVALVAGVQQNGARGLFSGLPAFLRRLDAVGHGVLIICMSGSEMIS